MIIGSSLLLDLDGVVVELVQRLADGSRRVDMVTAPEWVGICPESTPGPRATTASSSTSDASRSASATLTTNTAAQGGPAPAEHGRSHLAGTNATANCEEPDNQCNGPFPVQTTSLDRNFIAVRHDANLALPHNFSGFKFYGIDLCIVADALGRSAWAIDFHLRYNGLGKTDEVFYRQRKKIARKYRWAFRSRWIATTVSCFFLSRSPFVSRRLASRATHHLPRYLRGMRRARTEGEPILLIGK